MIHKCIYCGYFITKEDFEKGQAQSRWYPDTAYAPEKTEYFHVACDHKAAQQELDKLRWMGDK